MAIHSVQRVPNQLYRGHASPIEPLHVALGVPFRAHLEEAEAAAEERVEGKGSRSGARAHSERIILTQMQVNS